MLGGISSFTKRPLLGFGVTGVAYLVFSHLEPITFIDFIDADIQKNAINALAWASAAMFVSLLAYCVISATVVNDVMPRVREALIEIINSHIGPSIKNNMDEWVSNFIKVIKDKELAIHNKFDVEQYQNKLLGVGDDDPELASVHKKFANGNHHAAIKELREKAEKNPIYKRNLLSMLASSLKREYIDEAMSMLPEHGEAKHYLRIAYNQWRVGNLSEAIKLTKDGIEKIASDNLQKKFLPSLENGLAYYYADSRNINHKEEAMEIAKRVLTQRKELYGDGSPEWASSLDTLGYVFITFGDTAEEIKEGVDNCTLAATNGVSTDLLLKHSARASARLEEMQRC